MARNIVKLNESQIKEYIKEAVRKVVNEIGDTPRGQHALGAVRGRARARFNHPNPEYNSDAQRYKLNDTMNNASDAAMKYQKDDKPEMERANRKGFEYGFDKGLRESDERLGWSNDTWFIFADLKETLGCERLCHEIAGKLDEKTLQMILNRIVAEYDIYNYEEDEEYDF